MRTHDDELYDDWEGRPDFAHQWQWHDVQQRRSERKPVYHPQASLITFDVLYMEDDQRIGIYQTTSGTADHDAMAELIRLAGEHGIEPGLD
jgi:hypothetical protein